MASRVVTIHVQRGELFATGEECPSCRFDSLYALLVIVNGQPGFRMICGRQSCREDVAHA